MDNPKLSLFTPTNNIRYLMEAYAGLRQQNYENYEWLILLNGDAKHQPFPVEWPTESQDPRIKLILATSTSSNVGALKREACDACTGDAVVEFDHDDILVPGTLSKVAKAVSEGGGFIYSDVAVFEEDDLSTWGYHPSYGWENYSISVYGKNYTATRNFEIMPRSLCEVYYAPDHVRAWSRKAYYEAGGHDPALSVADDHDLICRTYTSGAPFVHIGGCGYLYRHHNNNTVKLRSELIKEQQSKNRHKYLDLLISEWVRRNKYKSLDLLKAKTRSEWLPEENRLTAADNSLGLIVASDVLQFLHPEQLVDFFNDAYRALMPGGYLTIAVPSPGHRYDFQNPLHKTHFNQNTFLYFSRKEFAASMLGVKCKFDYIHAEEFYPSPEFEKFDICMLKVNLAALKGQRWPGPKLI